MVRTDGRTDERTGGGGARAGARTVTCDYQNFGGWIEYQIFSAMALRSRARGAPMKYSKIPVRGCLGVFGASIQRPRRIRNWTIKGNNRTKSHSYMSENGYSYHIL